MSGSGNSFCSRISRIGDSFENRPPRTRRRSRYARMAIASGDFAARDESSRIPSPAAVPQHPLCFHQCGLRNRLAHRERPRTQRRCAAFGACASSDYPDRLPTSRCRSMHIAFAISSATFLAVERRRLIPPPLTTFHSDRCVHLSATTAVARHHRSSNSSFSESCRRSSAHSHRSLSPLSRRAV